MNTSIRGYVDKRHMALTGISYSLELAGQVGTFYFFSYAIHHCDIVMYCRCSRQSKNCIATAINLTKLSTYHLMIKHWNHMYNVRQKNSHFSVMHNFLLRSKI